MKLTKEQIEYFLADELKATDEYKKLGLNGLAKDEQRHADYFKELLRRWK